MTFYIYSQTKRMMKLTQMRTLHRFFNMVMMLCLLLRVIVIYTTTQILPSKLKVLWTFHFSYHYIGYCSLLNKYIAIFLPQDPFDADEFVERLAWRATGNVRTSSETFDPMVLHAAFEKTIKELKQMNQHILQQVNQMQTACNDEENAHWQRIAELHKHNQVA